MRWARWALLFCAPRGGVALGVARRWRRQRRRPVVPMMVVAEVEAVAHQVHVVTTTLGAAGVGVPCVSDVGGGLMVVPTSVVAVLDYGDLLGTSARRALGGGASGAAAGVVQVVSLMWLRTAMNFEYRYGGNGTLATVRALFTDGGVPRLYRGVGFALVQQPLSRFGDAAANAAVPAVVTAVALDAGVGAPALFVTQAAASSVASAWRILLTPLDAAKTALQVDGSLTALAKRRDELGLLTLWRGALPAAAATFVGNYPWFLTFNALDAFLPPVTADESGLALVLARRALLGCAASCASDVCSNSLRVIKTGVQTDPDADLTPLAVAKKVLATDGPAGLFGRGLQTRLAVNCLQGALFSVVWKYFESILVPN